MTSSAQVCDPALHQQIKDCESALISGQNLIHAQDAIIKGLIEVRTKQASEIQKLDGDIKDLEDSNNAWYKNPFLLIGLGFVGGVLVTK